jgi:hypothetical protein
LREGVNPEPRQSGGRAAIRAQLQTTMHKLHENPAIGQGEWPMPTPDYRAAPDP